MGVCKEQPQYSLFGLLAIFINHTRSFSRLLPIGKIFQRILRYYPYTTCLIFHCCQMVLVIVSVSCRQVIPQHSSLRQVSIRIIGISHHLTLIFISNSSQLGFSIITMFRLFSCLLHGHKETTIVFYIIN